jgi:hypothetical protein
MIIQIFYVVFFMHIWFDTDAFIEYSKLFRLSKLFKIDKWEEYREINPKLDYLGFLRLKHSSFFTRLISCKFCLCVWISLISCLTNILIFPVVYILSYSIYNILCRLIKY